MIRRLFSSFVELPANPLTSEFFQLVEVQNPRQTFAQTQLDNLNFLFECAPCFSVNGKNVRVINEPRDFYETLLRNAANARHRISMASLYLGVGKMETDLIEVIHRNLKVNGNLRVNFLLDYTRGTRGKKNSKTVLMPLIRQSQNCVLSLYHTPVLRGVTKRLAPARWNELIGLQHMKIYLFDDTVIISGANLSNDYFTNRQDRYIEIEDHKLANFFSSLIEKVKEFSLQVDAESGDVKLHESWNMLPYQSDQQAFANEAKRRMLGFFKKTFENQRKQNIESSPNTDTWIFPTLEMGQLNIHHDSVVMKRILMNIEKKSKLCMATGYFNLTQNLRDIIVSDCEAGCSFIMSHPSCNGFKGAKGPAGGIPDAYSLLARQFYEKITQKGQGARISLLEYERANWTYHAKGLWYYPAESALPCMTVIGSSNYGERSVNRDLESQLCLVTVNKTLQKSLEAEYEHLAQFATTAENELVNRFVPRWVKTVVFLFKNFF